MIKMLGSLFFLISVSAIGLKKAVEVKKRLRSIEAALIILGVYKSELSTSRAPMNAIYGRLENSQSTEVSTFGSKLKAKAKGLGEKNFYSIWSEAVKESLGSLPDDCITELCGLGAYVGRYVADAQLEAIDRCILVISAIAEEYRPKSAAEAKMFISLYSGIGLIITVMLI